MPPKRPVFIVGCARSGTTWLYHLLLSSGGFAIYRSETQFYNRFGPRFGDFSTKKQRDAFLDAWLDSEFFLRSGMDADAFLETVQKEVNSAGTMLNSFMRGICNEQSAPRWAECTPDNSLFMRQIKRDFPDALFVHVIRDGRDVALSLAKQRFIRPMRWHRARPELAAAAYWAWITQNVRKQLGFLGNDLLTIRYEDLVEQFDSTLLRISTFIEKPLDQSRIRSFSVGSVHEPNSSFDQKSVDSDGQIIPRWQKYCIGDTLCAMEEIIGGDLERLGYSRSTKPLGIVGHFRSKLIRIAYFCRFRLRHLLKKFAILNRHVPHGLNNAPSTDTIRDPTTRPRENISLIRRLVGP